MHVATVYFMSQLSHMQLISNSLLYLIIPSSDTSLFPFRGYGAKEKIYKKEKRTPVI